MAFAETASAAEPCKGDSPATMYCLVEAKRGPLERSEALRWSALQKTRDVIACGFEHFACERPFAYWIYQAGVTCHRMGENLAWGVGLFGSARAIFQAWLDSPSHRAILLGVWTHIGISRQSANGTRYWTLHVAECP